MISFSENGLILKVDKINSFQNFANHYENQTLKAVKELFITASSIDDFKFIEYMPNLEKLVILACKSNVWQTLHGHSGIKILRLHTLNQGKEYLSNIDFVSTFPALEYLYVNVLGITVFPDLSMLKSLHTICCSNKKLSDYSQLEHLSNLNVFIGWMATDNHRTPAEAFIPILKNHSLREFNYTQMFNVEDKKLKKYVDMYNPNIIYPMTSIENGVVNDSKVMRIVKLFF